MNPLADTTFAQVAPSAVFRIDYDLASWRNPWTGVAKPAIDLIAKDVIWLFLHHGGSANPGGELVEEPGLTWKQKVAVSFGIVRPIARNWEQWHIQGKDMKGCAYDFIVTQYGQVLRVRGWRANGGQWGGSPYRWNETSLAVAWMGGLGQSMTKAAWRKVGMIWLEASFGLPQGRALTLKPHNYTNLDHNPSYATTCPGDERTAQIAADQHLAALGVLRVRKIPTRRPQVRSLCRGLQALGFLDGIYGRYTAKIGEAVNAFRISAGMTPGTVCDRGVWLNLARTVSL